MLVGQTANCAILDDWAHHDNVYKQSSFAPKKVLYDISEPFRMDSQVAALEKTKNEGKERRKRKRPQLNCYVDPKFQQTCKHVVAVHADIVNLGQNFFHEKQEDSFKNNKDARAAANELSGLDALPCSSGQMSSFVEVDLAGSDSMKWHDDCCVLWRNSSNDCITVELSNSKYILPPRSAFILGDASLSRHLIQSSRTFDFILLDPPWENKAVKRQKTYATSFEDDLLSLPIDTLLAENGLVAIWVTNNQRLQRFVEDKLLAKWNLQKLARWHWLKLTTGGEFVCDFKPHYKVPFESIIFASRATDIFPSSTINCQKNLPEEFVFASTPSAVHSRKPSLNELLAHFDRKFSNCLEYFARYLLPNTVSIGFEALKLQNVAYFDEVCE